MAKGLSLHIGLNALDVSHYQGWDGQLVACEADAEDMEAIARERGFSSILFKTAQATREAVRGTIEKAAAELKAGDLLLVTYAGHGGRVPDQNNDEVDRTDETWCLYDGELIDDELALMWSRFEKNVRVLVVSDSCHSGTVTRAIPNESTHDENGIPRRFMPRDVALRTYRANRAFYERVASELPASTPPITASVRLLSGCQDNQYSSDGDFNGLFTGTLLRVWNEGRFTGDYREFHRQIVGLMPPTQTPNHDFIGSNDSAYDGQRPFQIE